MKASELINDLSQLIEDFGDLPVFVEHEENDKPVINIIPDVGFIICKNGSNSYLEYKLNYESGYYRPIKEQNLQ